MSYSYNEKPMTIYRFDRALNWLARHWIVIFGLGAGFFVVLPFLGPVFLRFGWNLPGSLIYTLYSFVCHQLPERSFFLFGSKFTYNLSEIQAAWQVSNDPMILRQFLGDAALGWKVAWSDRMASMFTSLWLFGLLWYPLRKHIPRLPWWGLVLFLLPMVLDGGSHIFSDLEGFGGGFRDSNTWLAVLTNNTLPGSFYAGDALGSFNSTMRLLTGVLFGAGIVWYSFPFLEEAFNSVTQVVAYKRQSMTLYQQEKSRILGGLRHE